MKKPPKKKAKDEKDNEREPSAFDRLKNLTRRIVSVPKKEADGAGES